MIQRHYNSKAVQLAETLADNILRNRFAEMRHLPAETRLASEYRVSRSTIRRALEILHEKGLIIREPKQSSIIAAGGTTLPIQETALSEKKERPARNAMLGFVYYMMYGEGQFVSNWIQTQLGHDLQYSLKPVRILNSENHMIRDGEMRFIPPEHIYTAIFEQLLQGAGGIVSWVWARNDYAVHQRNDAVDGCIFHRPAAIAAHGRAALDGLRLAAPIAQFVEAPPEIALVYSPSSHIQNPGDYTSSLRNTFTALTFTGRKIGFISEKQLAAGKFGKLKAIVLTDVTHLDAKAAAALAKFAEQSGKLFLVGAPPAFDSWGNPLKLRLAGEQVKNNLSLDESTRFWREKLADLLPLPFMLEAVGKTGTTGVFFRAVSVADGEWLVNIVNYDRESRRLRLSGPGAIEDLIGGGEFAPEFTLPPLKPLLLRIRTK